MLCGAALAPPAGEGPAHAPAVNCAESRRAPVPRASANRFANKLDTPGSYIGRKTRAIVFCFRESGTVPFLNIRERSGNFKSSFVSKRVDYNSVVLFPRTSLHTFSSQNGSGLRGFLLFLLG